MLSSLLTECKISSFAGCMAQIYFSIVLACTECASGCHGLWLLWGYLQPLALANHHNLWAICFLLVAGFWMGGFSSSMLKVVFISHLNFCDLVTNHLLWCITPAQPCPQGYVNGRDSGFHSGIDYNSRTIACGGGLLLLHSSCYNVVPHSSGEVESYFNLYFSPGSCCHLLVYYSVYLCLT